MILEISSAMEKRAENVQRVISQLFSTSLNGHLHRGDTIGIWTYNDKLHTGEFPLQRWTPQSVREITTAIALFAQTQKYSKQSRLAPVMAQLTNVVADSDKITVILISDGSEAIAGTPFDTQIADAFKLNAADQRKKSMPFVTVLRAVKGNFVGCKVSTPPWTVEFPPVPVEPTPVAPTPTNPPSATIDSPPTAPAAPSVGAQLASATAETNPPPPIPTNLPVVETPPPVVAEPTNSSLPAAAEVTSPPTTTNTAPAPAAQINAPPTNPPTPSATTVKPAKNLFSIPILASAALALVGLAIFCLALLRRSRETPRVSLITRSMNKERK